MPHAFIETAITITRRIEPLLIYETTAFYDQVKSYKNLCSTYNFYT